MAKELPARPNLQQLKKQAKELVDHCALGDDPESLRLANELFPCDIAASPSMKTRAISLSDAQLILARDYGFPSWPQLKHYVDSLANPSRLAWIGAIQSEDLAAIARLLEADLSLANSLHREFDDPFRKKRFPVATLLFAVAGPPPQLVARTSIQQQREPAVARLLLDRGADPNIHSHHGRPLSFATNPQLIELLISRGAQLNLWHDNGGSPLNFAIWGRCSIEHLALLLKFGADPNQFDRNGFTILHTAARYADEPQIKLLIAHGARLAMRNKNGETPRDIAARFKRPANVRDALIDA